MNVPPALNSHSSHFKYFPPIVSLDLKLLQGTVILYGMSLGISVVLYNQPKRGFFRLSLFSKTPQFILSTPEKLIYSIRYQTRISWN